ncbi:rRNA maturation RNase YbeY [Desulfobacterota bacterium AH_259_B03_O07]|nr:rRNA maturation RNase YbeY [Desulfobacterota bacterium AH_259_B03_O07]
MKIIFLDELNSLNKERKKKLKKLTSLILRKLEIPNNKELCITFVNDDSMRKINEDYRNINRTTDVLAFPQDGPDSSLLGDIIISIETAVRRSNMHNMKLQDEINILIIHGVLHLLGYNHKRKTEAREMREKESELFSYINSLK